MAFVLYYDYNDDVQKVCEIKLISNDGDGELAYLDRIHIDGTVGPCFFIKKGTKNKLQKKAKKKLGSALLQDFGLKVRAIHQNSDGPNQDAERAENDNQIDNQDAGQTENTNDNQSDKENLPAESNVAHKSVCNPEGNSYKESESSAELDHPAKKQKYQFGNIEYPVELLHQTVINEERFTGVKTDIYYEYSLACNPNNVEVPFVPKRDLNIPCVTELAKQTTARKKKRGSRIYVCSYCDYYFNPGQKTSADRHVDGLISPEEVRAPSCPVRKMEEPQDQDGSWPKAKKRPFISNKNFPDYIHV